MTLRPFRFLFDILFPAVCPGCKVDMASDTSVWGICATCINSLQAQPLLACSVCRNMRSPSGNGFSSPEERCHSKRATEIFSVLPYSDSRVTNLIKEYKFKKRASLATPLGMLLARSLKDNNFDLRNFVVCPIPLSSEHLRKRGFNQSARIAAVVARELNLPCEDLLVRAKQSKTQSSLTSWQERRINIAGSFAHAQKRQSKGRCVLLIDDVWTSGATLTEAVSVLRQAGARMIFCAVVARAGER